MPRNLFRRRTYLHIILALALLVVMIGMLAFYNFPLALLLFVLLVGIGLWLYVEEKSFIDGLRKRQETLTHRLKKTGDDVISHLPIGIILYNDQQQVEWFNPYLQELLEDEISIGDSLCEVIPTLAEVDLYGEDQQINHNDMILKILPKGEERVIYVQDVTEMEEVLLRYHKEQVVLGIIHMDNLDEVTQGMDEQERTLLLIETTSIITNWAEQLNIYLRRYAADKFLAVFDQSTLEQLESTRFDILDLVRNICGENKIPMTLSIGVATGVTSLVEMGRLTQSSLDIALGRGGDQAAVKVGTRLSFYGGKSNAVEKRTRVRARVISHALRDLIHECDSVFIMGHTNPDMDSLGAAMGILKAVLVNGQEGFIVLDKPYSSIDSLLKLIEGDPEYDKRFIKPEEAIHKCTSKSLVVVVDTHRPSMVAEPKLLHMTKRIMVIDHHRRGEEFIEDPLLLYLEPYASSTSELVTELLQYQSDELNMKPIEAIALLAGIIVDTRSFTYRTGSRTFEAASFLRRNGAEGSQVQKLLKEDMDHFIRRSDLIAKAETVFGQFAIVKGEEESAYDHVLIAQAADALMSIDGIKASFVMGYREDGTVAMSARSLGEINVQVIMEQLGGGGHLTTAAAQFNHETLQEVETHLLNILQQQFHERSVEQ